MGGARHYDGEVTEIDDETPFKDDQDEILQAHYVHQEGSPDPLRRQLQFDAMECGLDNVLILGDDAAIFGDDADGFSMDGGPVTDVATDVAEPPPSTDVAGPPASTADVAEPPASTDEPSDNQVIPIGDENSLGDALDREVENVAVEATDQPAEKPQEADKRKAPKSTPKHLENSRLWHKKWIKKGVPRDSSKTKKTATKSTAASAASTPVAKTAPKKKPATAASAEPKPIKTLAQAKDKFIGEWIQGCGMPPSNERRAAALKAWMESSTRSDLMAGKMGVQK